MMLSLQKVLQVESGTLIPNWTRMFPELPRPASTSRAVPCRAFIEQIREVVYQCLQRAPHTRVQLLSKVTQLGVSAVPLTPSDIQDILDTLVCDGYAEELPTLSAGPAAPSGLPSRSIGGASASGAASEAAGGATTREDKVVYRVCRQPAHYNYVSEIPCGACPVQHQCHPGGTVSPEKCVYMDKWLYEF